MIDGRQKLTLLPHTARGRSNQSGRPRRYGYVSADTDRSQAQARLIDVLRVSASGQIVLVMGSPKLRDRCARYQSVRERSGFSQALNDEADVRPGSEKPGQPTYGPEYLALCRGVCGVVTLSRIIWSPGRSSPTFCCTTGLSFPFPQKMTWLAGRSGGIRAGRRRCLKSRRRSSNACRGTNLSGTSSRGSTLRPTPQPRSTVSAVTQLDSTHTKSPACSSRSVSAAMSFMRSQWRHPRSCRVCPA